MSVNMIYLNQTAKFRKDSCVNDIFFPPALKKLQESSIPQSPPSIEHKAACRASAPSQQAHRFPVCKLNPATQAPMLPSQSWPMFWAGEVQGYKGKHPSSALNAVFCCWAPAAHLGDIFPLAPRLGSQPGLLLFLSYFWLWLPGYPWAGGEHGTATPTASTRMVSLSSKVSLVPLFLPKKAVGDQRSIIMQVPNFGITVAQFCNTWTIFFPLPPHPIWLPAVSECHLNHSH